MAGGDKTCVHNELRDTLHRHAQSAGTRPQCERSGLLGDGEERRRPADTLLNNRQGIRTSRARIFPKLALDVGVVCPQAACHVEGAAEGSAAAANAYTGVKRERGETDKRCEEAGVDYQPIVVESLGAMTLEASHVLHALHRLVADNTFTPVGEVATRFWRRASIDMQRSLHRAFVRRQVAKVTVGRTQASRELGTCELVEPFMDE